MPTNLERDESKKENITPQINKVGNIDVTSGDNIEEKEESEELEKKVNKEFPLSGGETDEDLERALS